ncbi:hexosaminidase D-like [Tachypleus tridentatus]|uniref:hexosaminidase D-like n=1 Tax=Tachypleus tridentatus TaxID=6853 RepID=UPI003FCF910E
MVFSLLYIILAFTDYHVANNRTNPLHIDQFLPKARVLLVNMEALNIRLSDSLHHIYDVKTVEEWFAVNVLPCLQKLRHLVRDAEQQNVLNACISTR